MKKLIVIGLILSSIILIAFMGVSNDSKIIWRCPKDEKISYIKTAEKPGKLYVVSEKGKSSILRAVYGPNNADLLLTVPSKTSIWNHPIQGHDPNEFLIEDAHRPYIHDFTTGKDTEIRGAKGVFPAYLYQPFSPDGKWLALSSITSDRKQPFGIYIVNRLSGRITPLGGIDTNNSNRITWTRSGLMVFNSESGTLYRGDEQGVKPVKRVGFSHLGFVTPDGNELITLSYIADNGILLNSYNLTNNDAVVMYVKHPRLSKEELNSMVLWHSLQYSSYSNEMTVSMSWPPIRPIYIDENRICKEIPIGRKKRLWYQIYGVAIWKPGMIAYLKDNNEKRPDVILSIRMK